MATPALFLITAKGRSIFHLKKVACMPHIAYLLSHPSEGIAFRKLSALIKGTGADSEETASLDPESEGTETFDWSKQPVAPQALVDKLANEMTAFPEGNREYTKKRSELRLPAASYPYWYSSRTVEPVVCHFWSTTRPNWSRPL